MLAFRWLATLFARDPVPAFLLGAAEVVRDNPAHTLKPSVVLRQAPEHANCQIWSIE